MKSPARRFRAFACPVIAAGVIAGSMTLTASAQSKQTTTSAWSLRSGVSQRAEGVERAQPIDVNLAALAALRAGDSITFVLFDGKTMTGTVERHRAADATTAQITGQLHTATPGSFVLCTHGEGFAGVLLASSSGTYRIRGAQDGLMHLEAINDVEIPWCDLGTSDELDPRALNPNGAHVTAPAGPGGPAVPAGPPCDDGSVIDLLVLYTQEARDEAGGTANILAEIDVLVANMNEAFGNSGVETNMHTVYVREVTTSEGSIDLNSLTDPEDGVLDGVHDLRNAYGADQVALIRSGGGGVANGLWNLDPESEANMFCINGRESAPFIIAHEIGHNLGCCHARDDGGGCPGEGGLLFPYSNGYRFTGDSGELWRTVMAYSPGAWSPIYSNPNMTFDGVVMGVPETESDSADNVQTINLARFTVSNWRCNDEICEGLDLPPDGDDCNENDVPDQCEIALGLLADENENGVPDDCEDCTVPADLDCDGFVRAGDLAILLGAWGPCPAPPAACIADLNGDGTVDPTDLAILLGNWG